MLLISCVQHVNWWHFSPGRKKNSGWFSN